MQEVILIDVLSTSDRLLFKEPAESDWKAVHKYASDPEVVRFMTWGPNTQEKNQNYIQRGIADRKQEPRSNYELAVVLPAEDRLIRGCSLGILVWRTRKERLGTY